MNMAGMIYPAPISYNLNLSGIILQVSYPPFFVTIAPAKRKTPTKEPEIP